MPRTRAWGFRAAVCGLVVLSGVWPTQGQEFQPQDPAGPAALDSPPTIESSWLPDASAANDEAERPPLPVRMTITPWIVDVYGRNYENFTNEGASRVVSDWLTNALIDLDLFNIVDRERIRAVLSERSLEMTGFARNVSRDVPENELATAGKLLSVNFILLGNVKNLGINSEIDFKLLDVETTTYSTDFRLNFQTPFNPSIEKIKTVIDRVVAELSASFPLVAQIQEIKPSGKLILRAGRSQGLGEGLRVEIWRGNNHGPVAVGILTRVDYYTADVELDEPISSLTITDYVAKIAVAPGPEAVLSSGRLKLQRGEIDAARGVFEDGLRSYPDHSRLLATHARTCWLLRDYEASVVSYRAALHLEPNDLALLEEAVQVLFEAGQFQEVVELLQSDSESERSLDLELFLGQALAIKGYPLAARRAYKRAFRLDPEAADAHLRLAVLAAQAGELDEMTREVRLASQSDQSNLEVELAAVIADQIGQDPVVLMAGLQPWKERAVEQGDFAALTTAGELLLHDPGYWAISLEMAERVRELNPAYLRATILAAHALTLGGDAEAAIERLDEAILANSNNVTLLVASGELLSRIGLFDRAEMRLLQAIDLVPGEWRPPDALGDHYYRQSKYLKAVGAYQSALTIAESIEGADQVPRLVKLSRSAVLGNQHATAQSYLERCIDVAPDDIECRYYLGVCYYQSNLPETDEKAIVNLKAATGFSSDSLYYLGALYDRREEFEMARAWHTQCVDSVCRFARESQERVDEIETIAGTIIGQSFGTKKVSLNVGRIHGVLPSQVAIVVSQGKVIGRIRTEEVQERTSEASIKGGKPKTGHEARFRPSRPKQLTVTRARKKGAILKWQRNTEPELIAYKIYRRDAVNGVWSNKRQVGASKTEFVDKSAKSGRHYEYRITALAQEHLESLPSREVEIIP